MTICLFGGLATTATNRSRCITNSLETDRNREVERKKMGDENNEKEMYVLTIVFLILFQIFHSLYVILTLSICSSSEPSVSRENSVGGGVFLTERVGVFFEGETTLDFYVDARVEVSFFLFCWVLKNSSDPVLIVY